MSDKAVDTTDYRLLYYHCLDDMNGLKESYNRVTKEYNDVRMALEFRNKQYNALLETINGLTRAVRIICSFSVPEAAKLQAEKLREATRNEGSNTGQAQVGRAAGLSGEVIHFKS